MRVTVIWWPKAEAKYPADVEMAIIPGHQTAVEVGDLAQDIINDGVSPAEDAYMTRAEINVSTREPYDLSGFTVYYRHTEIL